LEFERPRLADGAHQEGRVLEARKGLTPSSPAPPRPSALTVTTQKQPGKLCASCLHHTSTRQRRAGRCSRRREIAVTEPFDLTDECVRIDFSRGVDSLVSIGNAGQPPAQVTSRNKDRLFRDDPFSSWV
jgi:hypothetical protein